MTHEFKVLNKEKGSESVSQSGMWKCWQLLSHVKGLFMVENGKEME